MIGVSDDPDLSLSVPLQPLYQELTCPVCFQVMKECTMTPCSHNFCAKCIKECVEKRSKCPVCQADCIPKDLMRNIQLDRIIALVDSEKEKASKIAFSKLATPEAATSSDIKPLEEIFRKHLRKCMVAYDQKYSDLIQKRETEYQRIRTEFERRIEEQKQRMNTEDQSVNADAQQRIVSLQISCQSELTRVQKQYESSFELLLAGYDRLLEKSTPMPSFLPVMVTLTVERHPEFQFPDVMLDALSQMKDIELLFEERLKAAGNPIMERGDDIHFIVNVGSAAAAVLSDSAKSFVMDNPTMTVHEYHIAPNSQIVMSGSFKLLSEMPKQCFAKTFKPEGPNPPMDYYTCRTCKMNWICQPCAEQCHVGHDIVVYLKQHNSKWACCYCKKTKCCKCFASKKPISS